MQLEMLMLARFTIGCKNFTNGTAISVVGTSRKILLEISFVHLVYFIFSLFLLPPKKYCYMRDEVS